MTIMQLRYFVEIAKEKNITRAAEKLFISPQALSKSIRLLESEWGTALFQRADNGVQLSYVGMRVLPAVESLLKQYDKNMEIITTVLETSNYAITIVYEAEQLLAALPYEVFSKIGSARVITRRVENIEQCIKAVKGGEMVLALVSMPVRENSLHFRSLFSGYLTAIMPKGHPLAQRESIQLTDLKDEPFIGSTGGLNYSNYYIEKCIEKGFYPRFVLEYPTPVMILNAVAAGKGISIGPPNPGFTFLENDEEVLVRKPLEKDDLFFEAGFLMKKEVAEHPAVRIFLETIEKNRK